MALHTLGGTVEFHFHSSAPPLVALLGTVESEAGILAPVWKACGKPRKGSGKRKAPDVASQYLAQPKHN